MDHRSLSHALFCLSIFIGLGVGTCKQSSEKESGKWCVASDGASDKALKEALDYACGQGGADCTTIQPGASCYNPNTMRDHASYAFNDYYQKHPVPASCVFGGTATFTSKDPSSGNCYYASPGGGDSQATLNPPPPLSPATLNPPPLLAPPPSTESPHNAATSAFYSLPLLFISALLASLQVANCI